MCKTWDRVLLIWGLRSDTMKSIAPAGWHRDPEVVDLVLACLDRWMTCRPMSLAGLVDPKRWLTRLPDRVVLLVLSGRSEG